MDVAECRIIKTVKSTKRSLDETIYIQDEHESESEFGHFIDKRPRLVDSNDQCRKKKKKKKSKVRQEEKQNSNPSKNKNGKTKYTSVGTNTDALHYEIYAMCTGIISDPEIQIRNNIVMVSRATSPIPSNETRLRMVTESSNTDTASIRMTSSGTSPLPRFSNDSQISMETGGVSNDSMKETSSIAHQQKASNEILDVSNGLIVNELHSIGQTKITKALKSIVPNDYTDLKGKGTQDNSKNCKRSLINPQVQTWLDNNDRNMHIQKSPISFESSLYRSKTPTESKKSNAKTRQGFSQEEQKLLMEIILGRKPYLQVHLITEDTIKEMFPTIQSKVNRSLYSITNHWFCIMQPLILSWLHGKEECPIMSEVLHHLVANKVKHINNINMDAWLRRWPFHNEKSLRSMINRVNTDKRPPPDLKNLHEKSRHLLPYYARQKTPKKKQDADRLMVIYETIMKKRNQE